MSILANIVRTRQEIQSLSGNTKNREEVSAKTIALKELVGRVDAEARELVNEGLRHMDICYKLNGQTCALAARATKLTIVTEAHAKATECFEKAREILDRSEAKAEKRAASRTPSPVDPKIYKVATQVLPKQNFAAKPTHTVRQFATTAQVTADAAASRTADKTNLTIAERMARVGVPSVGGRK